jgi:hypothetical protein
MLRTIQRTLALAAVAGATPLIMLAAPAAAQSAAPAATDQAATQTMPQPATTVAEAGAPVADWVAIGPHEGHWYKFKYHSNHTDDPSQALARLKMSPADSLRFEIWTPGRLAAPPRDFSKDDQGTVREPVGIGNPVKIGEEKIKESDGTLRLENVYDGNVITWAGSSTASDTYYVFVKNTTDKPASYLLTVRGPDVSY